MTVYGTTAAVTLRTGVEPDDLGLADSTALDTAITDLLTEVTDLMNRRMRREWNDEYDAGTITSIPSGLHGIANDMAATALREMMVTRQTPVVRVDDFAVRTISSRLFTPDIIERLRLYSSGGASTLDIDPGDLADSTTSGDTVSIILADTE